MKDLDEYVLEIFFYGVLPGDKLHWSEVRNTLLLEKEITQAPDFNEKTFNVKVSRSLNRLANQGILQKHERGHKNTSYSLSENATEKLLEQQGKVGFMFLGVYKPGDSYEQFKDKAMQRLQEHFEPELKRIYNEICKR